MYNDLVSLIVYFLKQTICMYKHNIISYDVFYKVTASKLQFLEINIPDLLTSQKSLKEIDSDILFILNDCKKIYRYSESEFK